MDNATRQLVQYAHYHRDPRNIATHYIGIPLIVFAVAALLARVRLETAGLVISAD
ncbi:MAG: Mpo1-like protein, partial [Hydrogenophaga sp.]|nr:Mpo1-like protein [Hydrogenophaga sp.]